MNAQFHDEFVTLVALFYTDELSEEEWALLQIHLSYCDRCRQVFEEYKLITEKAIPALAASAATISHYRNAESDESFAAAELRLMERINTPTADIPTASSGHRQVALVGTIAACVIATLLYATFQFLRAPHGKPALASPNRPKTQPLIQSVPSSSQKVGASGHPQDDSQMVLLRQRLSDLGKQLSEANSTADRAHQQLSEEQAQRQQLVAERDSLAQQLATLETDSKSLRQQLASMADGSSQQAGTNTLLQGKVRELNVALEDANASLRNKDRMLELDKDFMAHDRDIRDLMGARNLYIADIYDTNTNGSTAKPFGRIFYTQDRSLVFYGFDLDKQPGMKQTAAFQAWGSGSGQRPVSLGLFYQDDSHKRWVLRFDDASTLSRLNMVFVTVEPPGGSNKPTGKQLLRAYLQIQPNHP